MGHPKNPDGPPSRELLADRVQAGYIEDANGCWIWQGYVNDSGYGVIKIRPHRIRAHRASWEALVGPIPDGLEIDHLCRVRRCVNPEHLEPVPHRVNALRGMAPAVVVHRTGICRNGHTRRNTIGACWDCAADYQRKLRARRSAERVAAHAAGTLRCGQGHEKTLDVRGRAFCPTCYSAARGKAVR
jgi:HNH endonuclease